MEIIRLRVDQLQVDRSYQREPIPAHVNRIAKDFREDQLQVLEVSKRGDGTYVIIDGQQRREAALIAKGPDYELTCNVHYGLTREQEAELYIGYQKDRKALKPFDLYKARLFAGDPIALAVDETVKSLGLKVGPGHNSEDYIHAVNSLMEVEKRFHKTGILRATLWILREAWYGEDGAYTRQALTGTSTFIDLYPGADHNRIVSVLRKVSPYTVHNKVNSLQQGTGGSNTVGYWRDVLVGLYDKGRQSKNKLKP